MSAWWLSVFLKRSADPRGEAVWGLRACTIPLDLSKQVFCTNIEEKNPNFLTKAIWEPVLTSPWFFDLVMRKGGYAASDWTHRQCVRCAPYLSAWRGHWEHSQPVLKKLVSSLSVTAYRFSSLLRLLLPPWLRGSLKKNKQTKHCFLNRCAVVFCNSSWALPVYAPPLSFRFK